MADPQSTLKRKRVEPSSVATDGESTRADRSKPKFSITVSMKRSRYNEMKREAGYLRPARTRERHHLSDGESDNEDPNILYRSLREEENPLRDGLLPPKDHDPSLTASQHITAGSRATKKGPWVSATRSRKVAAAWAATHGSGQIVRFRKPDRKSAASFDMTNPFEAKQVFPSLSGSSFNTAKSSQEVVIKNRVPPQNILNIFAAKKVSVSAYHQATPQNTPGMVGKLRSRAKVTEAPTPVILSKL